MEVYWLNEASKLLTYESELHRDKIYKFICVSKFNNENELVLVVASEKHENHYQLFEAIMSFLIGCEVVAAGKIDAKNKKVEHWFSKGFRVTTPISLRPQICKCLGVVDED